MSALSDDIEWQPMSEIDAQTRLYAVFGNPVAHSLSPVMHNCAFKMIGHNGVYVALRVRDIAAAVAAVRCLSIQGVSVTVPHKTAVIPLLDHIDSLALDIGAVNTILNQDGRLWGFNTDAPAAVRALKEKTALSGRQIAILGAGGAARAVGFGLDAEKASMVVVNRTESRGKQLAAELDADFRRIDDFHPADGTILINTTPVGMWPHIDATPFPAERLHPGMLVMDIIYNPLHSRLLREAAATGCRVVNGVPMFVYQGALQFERWTGKPAPLEMMRQVVNNALTGKAEANGSDLPSERSSA